MSDEGRNHRKRHGGTTANAIGMRGMASEVVLVDLNPMVAEAQTLDIAHAMPLGFGTTVVSGYAVVIAAGVAQTPGETRVDVLGPTRAVVEEVIEEVRRTALDGITTMGNRASAPSSRPGRRRIRPSSTPSG